MARILYFGSTTQIHSGACQWMFRMSDRMREYGHETLAVLPSDKGIGKWYRDNGIETDIRWSKPLRQKGIAFQLRFLFGAIWSILSLALVVRRENIDTVHINEIRYPYALVGAKLGGATVICHVRAIFDSTLVRKILAKFTHLFADRIICVSDATRESVFGEFGLDDEKVVTMHDGLPSPNQFKNSPEDSSFRTQYNISHDSVLVLALSKLVHSKGQDRLIRALNHLPEYQDIEVAIVGGEVDGHKEYAENLKSLSKRNENVHVTGFHDDIAEAFAASDIVAHLPRNEDPFPNVVLEAMTAGRPIIGSRSGGIPEQIVDGKTGYLVPKTNSEHEIADCISELYDDESERLSMGESARMRAFEEFSPQEYYDELDRLYRSLY